MSGRFEKLTDPFSEGDRPMPEALYEADLCLTICMCVWAGFNALGKKGSPTGARG